MQGNSPSIVGTLLTHFCFSDSSGLSAVLRIDQFMKAPKVAEEWDDAPTLKNKNSASQAHTYQAPDERQRAQGHHAEIFALPARIAMTAEEQNAAIRAAFTNDDTMPKERELREAIGTSRPSLVHPREQALLHRAAALIDAYSKDGCPADCGADWTREQIEAAIRRGPHPSAMNPDAKEALFAETDDKVANGYAKVIRYGDIKKHLPAKLKISPVAMIPHKSRSFRTILDLSFRLRHLGKLMESVNSATVQQAPAESMIQLGQCVQRLIAFLADNYNPEQPFLFSKLDIKDGFWRMAVNDENAWNFCYVLPSDDHNDDIDDILIVVPNCLQMGWCESPPFFCAASETARDVIEALLQEVTLPIHPFEDKMLDAARDAAFNRLSAAAAYVNLVEVFVDDFIGATNNSNIAHLEHFSRAMLFGVHSVFPPPEITGHQGQDPVSQKKLEQGEGSWATTKEILGWLVDGANFTIQLMPDKVKAISKTIKKVIKSKQVTLLVYQQLAGKLQHASFAIPGGNGLFSPVHKALKTTNKFITITPELVQILTDWRTLIQDLGKNPTSVLLLVSEFPNIIEYTDACKLGAGGVITPGMDPFQYWVWQYEWPLDIQKELITDKNRNGKLTINDLELAGLVLGWLVLEYVCADLQFKHVGMFCDNTSAVSWAYKGHTTTSTVAGRLLRLLSIRQRTRQASSLMPMNIAGKDNKMADIPSRAFKSGEFFHAKTNLVNYFNIHFPLSQTASWTEYRIPEKLASRVISCLRGELLPMEQLCKLPGLAKGIGKTGQHTAANAQQTHTSAISQNVKKPSSSLPLPQGYGPGLSVEEIKSKFLRSRTRLRPSPRPANWLDNKVPSTKRRENTFFPSSA